MAKNDIEYSDEYLVGKQVYIKKDGMWKDDLSGIELKNIPSHKREEDGAEIGSTDKDKIALIPPDVDLSRIRSALKHRILGIYDKKVDLNEPIIKKREGAPRTREEAKDYFMDKQGRILHKENQEEAYRILQASPDIVMKNILSVNDIQLLSHILSLETSGNNPAFKPRPRVVEAIERRMKSKNVEGVTIRKEGPEMILRGKKLTGAR